MFAKSMLKNLAKLFNKNKELQIIVKRHLHIFRIFLFYFVLNIIFFLKGATPGSLANNERESKGGQPMPSQSRTPTPKMLLNAKDGTLHWPVYQVGGTPGKIFFFFFLSLFLFLSLSFSFFLTI